jgi:hypothetical protein
MPSAAVHLETFAVEQAAAADAAIDELAAEQAAPEVAADMLCFCESIGQTPTQICNAFGFVTIKASRSEALGVLQTMWLREKTP